MITRADILEIEKLAISELGDVQLIDNTYAESKAVYRELRDIIIRFSERVYLKALEQEQNIALQFSQIADLGIDKSAIFAFNKYS